MTAALLRSMLPITSLGNLVFKLLPRRLFGGDSDWMAQAEHEAADRYERMLGHHLPVDQRREQAARRAEGAPRVSLHSVE